jgi:RNA polymerase sigma factor (sigma-70 family)
MAPDQAGEAEDRDILLRALAGLPHRQRAVLVLRYFEDLTEAQTAVALGCSVGTVKSQASRALARLREITPESAAGQPAGPAAAAGAGRQKGSGTRNG